MLRTALAVLVLGPLLSACAAVAAAGVVGVGVGLVQYRRNEAQRDFPSELEETWKAALGGLRELEIEPADPELGPTEGRIIHADTQVVVERHAEGFTRVRVRVGTFHSADNARRAELVLQEIELALQRQDELRAWAEKVKEREEPGKPGPVEPR